MVLITISLPTSLLCTDTLIRISSHTNGNTYFSTPHSRAHNGEPFLLLLCGVNLTLNKADTLRLLVRTLRRA